MNYMFNPRRICNVNLQHPDCSYFRFAFDQLDAIGCPLVNKSFFSDERAIVGTYEDSSIVHRRAAIYWTNIDARTRAFQKPEMKKYLGWVKLAKLHFGCFGDR
jgi:hypothetical protein